MRTLLTTLRLIICAPLLLAACQAAPPTYEVRCDTDSVRSESPFLANDVAKMLERGRERVIQLVPFTKRAPLEVWLQEELQLYAFSQGSYEDADGFWAEDVSRIHLRTGARHIERTLVHELVHASLDESWKLLPGTMEEGLCDWVSTIACPHASAQLRAGRLSAACFGLGSLEIEVELRSAFATESSSNIAAHASIILDGGIHPPLTPMEVFTSEAGRSNSGIPRARKKALYGLAYFLVERIATSGDGLDALHRLCVRASDEGLEQVPAAWILKAADLNGGSSEEWKECLADSFAAPELAELVAMYPDFLGSAIDRLTVPPNGDQGAGELRFAMRVTPR
ncbi:MAG: hypothetical protein OSB14_03255 [Planctomycetota bacterium]|nr:hypothetical protein [Planctomycetota bacterium]